MKKYKIRFKELELGEYNFDFGIDKLFFDEFEKSEIKEGKLTAIVNLLKEERNITLDISIDGVVNIICDRCLEYFEFPVHFTGKLYIKPNTDIKEEKDFIIGIEEDDTEINLSQYFYESIHLSLPLKRVHPDDKDGNSTCDAEMLKLLEKHKKDQDSESIDPRWEKLKNLNVERN